MEGFGQNADVVVVEIGGLDQVDVRDATLDVAQPVRREAHAHHVEDSVHGVLGLGFRV